MAVDVGAVSRPQVAAPPPRLRVLVGTIGVLGAVTAAAMLGHGLTQPLDGHGRLRLLLVAALVVAFYARPLQLRFRSNQAGHFWGEIALVVGLVLTPLSWLVVATWTGTVLTNAVARRGLAKSVYNAGTYALGTLLAGLVVAALHPGRLCPFTLPAALPLLVGVVTFALFADLAICTVVSAAERAPLLTVLRDGFVVHQLICVANGLVAIAFLALARWNLTALVSLPALVVTLHWAQASGLRVAEERDAWQQLDVATRELNSLNKRTVIETAIARACDLFRCDVAEIRLQRGADLRVIAGTLRGVAPDATVGLPLRRIVARSLNASDVTFGELRLLFTGPVGLSERESWALSTFSHALSAALLNAELYEEMQEHAALKAHEAAHDPLTGLANRTVLTERATGVLAEASAAGRTAALLLVDLDHFKQVNDTLGHEAGDELLREVAHRLLASVRASDLVVRLGGDEFALLLPDLADEDDAAAIAAAVRAALAEPIAIDGLELPIEASIGVACAPTDATTVRELLRCADMAMYSAKGAPHSVRRYRPQDDVGNVDRLTMVSELRTALEQGQVLLHFQPTTDLVTGRVIGAEALARWQRPRHGLVSACDFVPVIEQSSLVHAFTSHVLDLALAAAADWGAGPGAPTIAVNLSARNLLDRALPRDIGAALERYGVAPARLILEITETVVMSELDVVDEVLAALRNLGVQLSVDDFGTGFSSLNFLSRIHVDEVKIDRSFVDAMQGSPGDAAIVRAVLELGRSFGLRVVAEGVESPEQRDLLRGLGCQAAQGDYLAPALSPAAVRELFLPPVIEIEPPAALAALHR